MNKKFSTLVASLLFATCFGASAQTYVDTEIASGSTFLLGAGGSWAAGNEADNVLTINDKGELALLPKADVKTASKVNRAKALWKVSYTQDAHKAYTFTFVNESTGQTLVLPKSGAATAHVAEGLGELHWQLKGVLLLILQLVVLSKLFWVARKLRLLRLLRN